MITAISATLRALSAITLTALLAGCTLHGQGPVELSTKSAHAFARYQEILHNKAFAVTTDGKAYGVAYCPDFKCTGNVQSRAITFCEQSELRKLETTAECKIFAVDEQILWEGEITVPGVHPETFYAINPAEGTKIKGPEAATGAVVYVPGNHPARDIPQDDAVVPFYLRNFAQSGWDAFKLIPARDDLAGHDRAAAGVQARLQQLRAKGYERVVIAGQSFGSWTAIHGSGDEAFGADAVIAAAPASFGARNRDDGRPNPFFNNNKAELIPLLRKFQGRLMLILFAGDAFDPGGRAYLTREILTERGVDHFIIDQPPGFTGHGAAWLSAFDFVYGDCLKDFAGRASMADGFECKTPPADPNDHRWMSKQAHLKDSPAKPATQADLDRFIGNTVIGHLANGAVAEYYLRAADQTIVRIRSGYQRTDARLWETSISEEGFCFPDICYDVYLWSEDFIIAVDENGNIAFRGELQPGDTRELEVQLSS
ncbi:MAG: hypothetical protein AAFW76_03830 [Pseudomonadota bacterium]